MAEQLWFGILLLLTLLLVSFLGARYYEFQIWTVFAGVSLMTFSFFYIPMKSYTWELWAIENTLVWTMFFIIVISEKVYIKFTTKV